MHEMNYVNGSTQSYIIKVRKLLADINHSSSTQQGIVFNQTSEPSLY